MIDEIIVLIDDSTTDSTEKIVNQFPEANSYLIKWEGFAQNKATWNRVKPQMTGFSGSMQMKLLPRN